MKSNKVSIAVILLITFASINILGADKVKIFYIPFCILTSIPVTDKDIEKRSHYKTINRDKKSIEKLKIIIKQCSPGKFNESMVRAEVKFPDTTYYFDAFGGMKKGNESFQVASATIEKEFMQIFKIK